MTPRPILVEISCLVYRRLVQAYPPKFQAKYGESMVDTFEDMLGASIDRYGTAGILFAWVRIALDFAQSLCEEHLCRNEEKNKMKFPAWIKPALLGACGTLFIVASISLVLAYVQAQQANAERDRAQAAVARLTGESNGDKAVEP